MKKLIKTNHPILKEGDVIVVKTYNGKFPYLGLRPTEFKTIQAYNVQLCVALDCTCSDCLTKQTFSVCEIRGIFKGANCCNTNKFVARKATKEEAWMYILYGPQEVERDG